MRLYEFDAGGVRQIIKDLSSGNPELYKELEELTRERIILRDKMISTKHDNYELMKKIHDFKKKKSWASSDEERSELDQSISDLQQKASEGEQLIMQIKSEISDLNLKRIDITNKLGGDFESYIESKGYRFVGGGTFGNVYKKGNIVCKSFSYSDKCFLKYIEYTRKKRHNPYVPVFTKPVISHSDSGDLYYVTFSKLLTEMNFDVKDFLEDVLYKLSDLKNNDSEYVDEVEERYPGLVQTLVDIQRFYSKLEGKCKWDLHKRNFMMDGDTPVITDPYATIEVAAQLM